MTALAEFSDVELEAELGRRRARTVLRFVLPGEPMTWKRVGVTKLKSGKLHHYTPKQTRVHEKRIADLGWLAMREARRERLIMGARLEVRAFWSPSVADEQRADFDNLAKSVSDGLNRVCYLDDRQIRHAEQVKASCAPGEEPRTEITVSSLDEEWA